jgi:hypothetical protein
VGAGVLGGLAGGGADVLPPGNGRGVGVGVWADARETSAIGHAAIAAITSTRPSADRVNLSITALSLL